MEPESCRIRFGSLDVRLRTSNPRYIDMITPLFRVWPSPDDATEPDVELVVVDGEERRPRVERLEDIMQIVRSDGAVRVSTAIAELTLRPDTVPMHASLVMYAAGQDPQNVDHYMLMILQKLLQLLGRLRLHGAAVVLGGRTYLFLGDKGAGKSTLSLALGRAGGTVLADDQLVLRHDGTGVWVSGVDGRLRLTAATERHFFTEAMDVVPQDFAGTLKKEVPLADLVPAQPCVDHVPDVLFFSRVGDALAVDAISRSVAVRRILDTLSPVHRFAGSEDVGAFLGLVTSLVGSVDVFDLSLSPDLFELDELVARLREMIA